MSTAYPMSPEGSLVNRHLGRTRLPRRPRQAFSLVEVVIASASAVILLGGLASGIYITSEAFDAQDGTVAGSLDANLAADEVLANLRLAKTFLERSPTTVEFLVPDRDGDGVDETLRYAWSGTSGDPLTIELNGSSPDVVIDSIHDFDLTYSLRTLTGIVPPTVVYPEVVYEGFTETKQGSSDNEIRLQVPSGVAAGDLLVAAIVAYGDVRGAFEDMNTDWVFLDAEKNGKDLTVGVWWRIADAAEPLEYTFDYEEDSSAYGWMMHFSGNDTQSPIDGFGFDSGDSDKPETPSVTTATERTLLLKIGGFTGDSITEDDAGMDEATTITMDGVITVSGGAAFHSKGTAGATGTSEFSLVKNQTYVTATLALKPGKVDD